MLTHALTIRNKLGLHARASAKLSQTASRFAAEVWLSKGTQRVNAKSIMGVMMLAAGQGCELTLETQGADEQAALDAVTALVDDLFGESE